ncbi:MAG: AtpZ/AtpI family protein [Armatimonadota bacterium]
MKIPEPPAIETPVLERPQKKKRGSSRFAEAGGNKAIAASTVGLTMALTIGIFWWIGSLIDRKLGFTNLYSMIGAIGGAIGGFYQMIRILIDISKDDK